MKEADVIIVGAGPAGSVAAAVLAAGGRDVLVLEKDRFPRNKLCGEFISPEAHPVLAEIGALEALLGAGARRIGEVRITGAAGGELRAPLGLEGIALRRYSMDRLLAEAAASRGASIRQGEQVVAVEGNLEDRFKVTTNAGHYCARLVIGAQGRRSAIDRNLERPALRRRTPYVAFKQYFGGASAESAAVELHAIRGGYCGIVEVEDGSLNACWMVRQEVLAEAGSPHDVLAFMTARNTFLDERLRGGRPLLERPMAVSNMFFQPRPPVWRNVPMVGDASGMISPLCGDGMAMAIVGGDMIGRFAMQFLNGGLTTTAFTRSYRLSWRRAFGRRMMIGNLLQMLLMGNDAVTSVGLRALHHFPAIVDRLFHATRS